MERIDIEQARKRAKELVRAWRASGTPGRLTDAQREIARGLDFPSWPALVHHTEAEAVDRAQRHETFVSWATNGPPHRADALPGAAPPGATAPPPPHRGSAGPRPVAGRRGAGRGASARGCRAGRAGVRRGRGRRGG